MNKFIILFLIVGLAASMVSASGFSVGLVEAKDSDSGGDDSSDSGTSDNGDNGGSDSGSSDNGGGSDSGSSDSGTSDNGGPDSGSSDNGDTDSSDSGSADTGTSDSGSTDNTATPESAPVQEETPAIADTATANANAAQVTNTNPPVVNPLIPAKTPNTDPNPNPTIKIPKHVSNCNGTFKDCRTKEGFFCKAGSGAHECECDNLHSKDCGGPGRHRHGGHNTVVVVHKTKTVHEKDSHSITTVFVPDVGLVQPLNCKLNQNNGKIGCEFVVIKVIN